MVLDKPGQRSDGTQAEPITVVVHTPPATPAVMAPASSPSSRDELLPGLVLVEAPKPQKSHVRRYNYSDLIRTPGGVIVAPSNSKET